MFVINNTYYNIFRDRESNGRIAVSLDELPNCRNEKEFNMELEVKT